MKNLTTHLDFQGARVYYRLTGYLESLRATVVAVVEIELLQFIL